MEKIECQVCFDNIKENQILKCCFCEKDVCKNCIAHWMKEKKMVTCPLCNNLFKRNFITEKFGKPFMYKFAKIEKETLLMREKLMIPEYSQYLNIPTNIEKLKKLVDDLKEMHMKYKKMKISELKKEQQLVEIFGANFTKKVIYTHYRRQIEDAEDTIHRYRRILNTGVLPENENLNIGSSSNVVKPVCPCPINDCKGYIRNTDHKCCICEKEICKKCYVVMEESNEHTCKNEDLETVKQIKKESKPCPTCGARISKIDGCDQMYCIMCDTAFSWNTGRIERGRIHNPEYYRKLREKNIEIPREDGDNPCADRNLRLGYELMRTYVNSLKNKSTYGSQFYYAINSIVMTLLQEFLRMINHNRENLDQFMRLSIDRNLRYRLDYIQNEISEERFMDIIYKQHTKTVFSNEIYSEINDTCNTLELLLVKANDIVSDYLKFVTANFSNYQEYDFARICYDKYIKEIFAITNTGYEFLQHCKMNVDKIKNSYHKYTTNHYHEEYMFVFEEFGNVPGMVTKEDQIVNLIESIRTYIK